METSPKVEVHGVFLNHYSFSPSASFPKGSKMSNSIIAVHPIAASVAVCACVLQAPGRGCGVRKSCSR